MLLAVDDVLHAREGSCPQTTARHELETLGSLAQSKLEGGLAGQAHGLWNRIESEEKTWPTHAPTKNGRVEGSTHRFPL